MRIFKRISDLEYLESRISEADRLEAGPTLTPSPPHPITPSRLRRLALHALSAALSLAAAARGQEISAEVAVVDGSYTWGYRSGVKQPAGHWLHGRGVHNLSRETWEVQKGSPDYLVWIDSHAGVAEIRELGHDDAAVTNPGGQAAFDVADGSILCVLSGRADDLPFDMLRVDPSGWAWETLADDFVTYSASTTACVSAPAAGTLLHCYRYAGSSHTGQVAVRAQRWDLAGGAVLIGETELARGGPSPYGDIGIEQLNTCHDPRFGVAITWQWWDIGDRRFGSLPWVSTDDGGATWRGPDGGTLALPLRHGDIALAYDHVALGEDGEWHPRDLGWTPGGLPYLTLKDGGGRPWLFRHVGGAWSGAPLAGAALSDCRPFAMAVTRDCMVFVYAEASAPGDLYAAASRDDGATWGDPVLVDSVTGEGGPGPDEYRMVSVFHPARHLDNTARLLLTASDGWSNHRRSYENCVRFLSVRVGPRSDFDGDGALTSLDYFAYAGAWGSGDWRADFDDDGDVDQADLEAYAEAFEAGE